MAGMMPKPTADEEEKERNERIQKTKNAYQEYMKKHKHAQELRNQEKAFQKHCSDRENAINQHFYDPKAEKKVREQMNHKKNDTGSFQNAQRVKKQNSTLLNFYG